ncbi:MAG: aldehyde dehydrogenase family protein, partial [Candidatus Nanohaloarchaea archaeon]|nr:aldehyde dehydrogenase family protein [Candidatus Nanohaloarchaea archaeon]
ILHQDIAEEFMDRLQTRFEAMRVGDPLEQETDIGPMAREDLRDDLAEQVRQSVDAGADLVHGGTVPDRDGYFYEPTIIRNPPEGSPAYDEELFGPVSTVFTVEDTDAAIELANTTSYGLGASLWTEDTDRAEDLVPRIEAGNVFVNELVKSDPRLPFGGVKDSGYGRELGEEGIKEFVNRKTVYIE